MHRLLFVCLLFVCTAACATRVVRTPNAPTADVQLKLATLPRVWVAGFATDKKHLLRLQLRTWSSAQVIEAEPQQVDVITARVRPVMQPWSRREKLRHAR